MSWKGSHRKALNVATVRLPTTELGSVVYEHLSLLLAVYIAITLPDSIKCVPAPKALKILFKRFFASKMVSNVGEFSADKWETTNFENWPCYGQLSKLENE